MEELLKEFMKEMREFRSEVNQRLDTLEDFRTEVNQRFNTLEEGNQSFRNEVNQQFDGLKVDIRELKGGQDEIKELLKHNTMLLTENFTDIRIDLRQKNSDMKADVDLLFREVEEVKRETNKIKQKLGN